MELYRRYGPALRRRCERMLGNPQDAEDVVQAIFVELIQRGRADVELGYLYRAATTRCLNRLRDGQRRRTLLDRHAEVLLLQPGGDAEARAISVDLLSRLVARLDRRSAEILAYAWLDGMNQGEIAALMGISRRAVVKRIAKLREILESLVEEGGA